LRPRRPADDTIETSQSFIEFISMRSAVDVLRWTRLSTSNPQSVQTGAILLAKRLKKKRSNRWLAARDRARPPEQTKQNSRRKSMRLLEDCPSSIKLLNFVRNSGRHASSDQRYGGYRASQFRSNTEVLNWPRL
jgi:hypothetical protein